MFGRPWLQKATRSSQGKARSFEPWLQKTKYDSQGRIVYAELWLRKTTLASQGQVASARSWLRIITCASQGRRNETLLGMASPRDFRRSAAGNAIGGAVSKMMNVQWSLCPKMQEMK